MPPDYFDIGHESDPIRRVDRFTVSLRPDVPWGVIVQEIRLRTNDPLLPNRSVHVTGEVLLPVKVEPQEVLLGDVRPGETKSVSIKLFSPYELPLRVTEVEPKNSFTVSQASDSKAELNMNVEIPSTLTSQILKSTLEITVLVGDYTFRLPVDVYGVSKS